MENIPDVEMRITDDNDSVNCISLVEKPAIESNFVHLSENSIEMKIIDEEKSVL